MRYDILLNPLVMLYTVLLVIIPLLAIKINYYLQKTIAPPWKLALEKEQEDIEQKRIAPAEAEE